MNNKYFRTILSFIFCISFSHAYGQTAVWETLVTENKQLQKEIDEAAADTLKSFFRKIELQSKIKELDTTISSTEKQISDISNSVDNNKIQSLFAEKDSLDKVKRILEDRKALLAQDKANVEGALSHLEESLSSMDKYSQIKQNKELSELMAVLNRRYSELKMEQLKELDVSLKSFTLADNYEEYVSRVCSAIENKELYERGSLALRSPFDESNIGNIRSQLQSILSIQKDEITSGRFKLSQEQYSELDSLNIRLSRYKTGIKELQAIVSLINTDENISLFLAKGDIQGGIEAIRSIIFSESKQAQMVRKRYFETIPYLNELLHAYWNELRMDPLDPTKTQKVIMNLLDK